MSDQYLSAMAKFMIRVSQLDDLITRTILDLKRPENVEECMRRLDRKTLTAKLDKIEKLLEKVEGGCKPKGKALKNLARMKEEVSKAREVNDARNALAHGFPTYSPSGKPDGLFLSSARRDQCSRLPTEEELHEQEDKAKNVGLEVYLRRTSLLSELGMAPRDYSGRVEREWREFVNRKEREPHRDFPPRIRAKAARKTPARQPQPIEPVEPT